MGILSGQQLNLVGAKDDGMDSTEVRRSGFELWD